MDLLKRLIDMYKKQQGVATLIAIAAVAVSFGLGMWFKHYSTTIDHPAEEFAEDIINDYLGTDVDFSKAKKEAAKKK